MVIKNYKSNINVLKIHLLKWSLDKAHLATFKIVVFIIILRLLFFLIFVEVLDCPVLLLQISERWLVILLLYT